MSTSQIQPIPQVDPLLVPSQILFYTKLGCIFVIIIITLTFGFMPLFCTGCRKSSKLLGIANAFSGGLFMGIGLFHLLPEAGENFEKYFATPEGISSVIYGKPMPYFIAFVSYSLILFLEKVAFDSHSLTEHTHHKESSNIQQNELEEPLLEKKKENKENSNSKGLIPKEDIADEYFNVKNEPNPKDNIYHDCFAVKFNKRYSFDKNDNCNMSEVDSDQDENTLKNVVSSKGKFASYLQARNLMQSNEITNYDKSLFAASRILERTMEPYGKVDEKSKDKKPHDIQLKIADSNSVNNDEIHPFHPTSLLTPYILLIALSLHGLFEGTALGVMTKMRTTLFLFIAILAHKWAESFALGLSFYRSGTNKGTFIKMILLFSLFTPIGITVGLICAGTSYLLQGILLSVSGGTFLYVSASEVIVEEFAITKYRYTKYFFYLCGGVLVGLLAWFEVEE